MHHQHTTLMTTPVRIVVLFVLCVPMRILVLSASLRNSCSLMRPAWRNVQLEPLMRNSSARIVLKSVNFVVHLRNVLLVLRTSSYLMVPVLITAEQVNGVISQIEHATTV